MRIPNLVATCSVAAAAIVALAAPSRAQAAGKVRFCGGWQYTFVDQGLGEDRLLHAFGLPFGRIAAAYSKARIERNGALVWEGHTDANGCTPQLDGQAGTYTHIRQTDLDRSGRTFKVKPNNTSPTASQYQASVPLFFPVPNGTTQRIDHDFGLGQPSASAAAVVTELIHRDDMGVVPSFNYQVFADQNCPGSGIAACLDTTNGGVFLGTNNLNQKQAFNKTVTAHELGHLVGVFVTGALEADYGQSVSSFQGVCRCDHVTTSDASHCLQSREHISAAQWEGFAHFFAADLLNDSGQPGAIFAYYKEFLFFLVAPPPVPIDLGVPRRWMETFCEQADSGVELDWATFFWDIRHKGANRYSYDDLARVYRKACGGFGCGIAGAPGDPSWSDLNNAAQQVFGVGSAKANRFIQTGATHGVDH